MKKIFKLFVQTYISLSGVVFCLCPFRNFFPRISVNPEFKWVKGSKVNIPIPARASRTQHPRADPSFLCKSAPSFCAFMVGAIHLEMAVGAGPHIMAIPECWRYCKNPNRMRGRPRRPILLSFIYPGSHWTSQLIRNPDVVMWHYPDTAPVGTTAVFRLGSDYIFVIETDPYS